MPPELPASSTTSPNRLQVAGRGVAIPGPGGVPIHVAQVDADLLDLTPDDPLSLDAGTFALDVRRAEIRLDRAALVGLVTSRVPGAKDLQLGLEAPDRLVATGRSADGPFRIEGRLAARDGRLAFLPTRLEGPVDGVHVVASPQRGRVSANVTDRHLVQALNGPAARAGIADIALTARGPGDLAASATVKIDGKPGRLDVDADLQPAPDGQLDMVARKARLTWEGLTVDLDPARSKAHVHATAEAVEQRIARAMASADVRKVGIVLHAGERADITAEIRQGGQWRPITINAKLDAVDGALRLTPDRVRANGLAGDVDVDLDPRSGRGTATLSEATLNARLAPIAAQNGLKGLRVRLLDGNRFEVTGRKLDAQTGQATPLRIQGHMVLAGPDALRFEPDHLQLGERSLDMHSFTAGLAKLFGWSLADEIKIRTPFAQMDGDALVLRPSRLPRPMAGQLESVRTARGKLVVTGRFAAQFKDVMPKSSRLTLRGNTMLVKPSSVFRKLEGQVTGVRTTGRGLDLDLRVTPDQWMQAIALRGDGFAYRGDRLRFDVGRLTGLGSARAVSAGVTPGAIQAELAGDPDRMAGWAPTVPGLTRDGAALVVDPAALGVKLAAPVTGVRVGPEGVTVQVGDPTPAAGLPGVQGKLDGKLAIAGVTLEDAVIGVEAPAPNAPTIAHVGEARMKLEKGRATVPVALMEALVAQAFPPKPGGYDVKWAGDHLAVKGTYGWLGVTGRLRPEAGGKDGVALVPEGFRWGWLPLPRWLAARFVAGEIGGKAADGRAYLDPGGLSPVGVGAITGLRIGPKAIEVAIG